MMVTCSQDATIKVGSAFVCTGVGWEGGRARPRVDKIQTEYSW